MSTENEIKFPLTIIPLTINEDFEIVDADGMYLTKIEKQQLVYTANDLREQLRLLVEAVESSCGYPPDRGVCLQCDELEKQTVIARNLLEKGKG